MKFNIQFFNASYKEDFHFLALEQELLIMAPGPISPFFEKNHNFSVASSQGNACLYLCKKSKNSPYCGVS